jgi:PIN domain nuclease of toxin-antitoxin system
LFSAAPQAANSAAATATEKLRNFVDAARASGFSSLTIADKRAPGVQGLPIRHADRFDRLLIAQAMAEPLRLLTADTRLAPYSEFAIQI